jgi:type IV pilus assembly protein PilE
MITVAVFGILAAIAYPSYTRQVQKTRRADAQGTLMELSNFMERFFTENNRYDQNRSGTAVTLPFTKSPKDGSATYYTLSLAAVSSTGYTLLATPAGPQASDGKLELLNSGERRWDKNGDGDTTDAGENSWGN